MLWSTAWSRSTNPRWVSRACLVAVLLLVPVLRAPAQDADQLYKKGMDLWNSAQAEDACDVFKQVESLKPGYQQTRVYMRMACDSATKVYAHEQEVFEQGDQLFKQGHYDDAKHKFLSALEMRLKKPNYREKAQRLVKEIDAYQEGEKLSRLSKFKEAGEAFAKLAQGNDRLAQDANKMLVQVDAAQRKHQAEQIQAKAPPPAVSAGNEPAQNQRPQPAGGDETLRAGLQAFFRGAFDFAETSLTDYLSNNGQKRDLAFFFRGASRSSRYYLSGEKDSHQKDLALEDFRALKDRAAQFRPPADYVSPKILALYREAVGAPAK